MSNHQERDAWIRERQEAGTSLKEIAVACGMSVKAVQHVLRKLQADGVAVRRSKELLQEFRRADDLDRKWKVAEVLNALLLVTTTRTALKWWFEGGKTERTSLREFMDLVISQKDHAKSGYLITPLLDMRCVGVKGFWSAVRRLTESDLGERCNEEWRRRLVKLRRALRIVGVQRTWSKPCEPPPWLLSAEPKGGDPKHEV